MCFVLLAAAALAAPEEGKRDKRGYIPAAGLVSPYALGYGYGGLNNGLYGGLGYGGLGYGGLGYRGLGYGGLSYGGLGYRGLGYGGLAYGGLGYGGLGYGGLGYGAPVIAAAPVVVNKVVAVPKVRPIAKKTCSLQRYYRIISHKPVRLFLII